MAKTPDFTKTLQDLFSNFPVDTSSVKEAVKSQASVVQPGVIAAG